MTQKAPKGFKRFLPKASKLLKRPAELNALISNASKKLAATSSSRLSEAQTNLALFLDLLSCYVRGTYRGITNETLVAIAAAVLYFLVQLDMIPDFILAWGLLDDIAVVTYIYGQVRDELEKFKAWRADNTD
jgi:uncharacterized membrane protein YkvA (DUF1232 family)